MVEKFIQDQFINKKENLSLSFDREDLNKVLNSEEYNPENLIKFLEPDFKDAYESNAGVWEGYTIKEHTLMVMNQFEKYYSDKELPGGVDKGFFRFLLSLHDIGKAEAVKINRIHRQHEFTLEKVGPVFKELGFNEKEKHLFDAIVGADNLGAYLKGSENINNTFFEIIKANENTGLALSDFYKLLEIYYKVDAGSYTKDSGGKESLDKLFDFDHENRNLNFSNEVEEKIVPLRKKIYGFDKQKEQSQKNIEESELYRKILAEVRRVNIRPENRNEKSELLAPNGQPSNLSEEEWKITRTPSFKKWFGDFEEKFNKDDLEAWTKHQYKKSLELKALDNINERINNEKKRIPYLDKEEYIKDANEHIAALNKDKIAIQHEINRLQAELINGKFSPLKSDYGKLLDENGEPLILCRSSDYGPDDKGNFEIPMYGKNESHGGFKFGTFLGKKSEAWFQRGDQIKQGKNSLMYRCFVSPRNLDILPAKYYWGQEKELIEKIMAKYDGIIVKNSGDKDLFKDGKINLMDLVIFDPKNILILGVE
jgi:hypothetical protein